MNETTYKKIIKWAEDVPVRKKDTLPVESGTSAGYCRDVCVLHHPLLFFTQYYWFH